METTKVIIEHESKELVKVYWTLGAVEKVKDVSQLTNMVNHFVRHDRRRCLCKNIW